MRIGKGSKKLTAGIRPSGKNGWLCHLVSLLQQFLHDELHLITDRAVLNETLKKDQRGSWICKESSTKKKTGIALKDKTLSPKKKIAMKVKRTKLAGRKKKDYFKKRVGSVADTRNAKICIEDKVGSKDTQRGGIFIQKKELLEQENDP